MRFIILFLYFFSFSYVVHAADVQIVTDVAKGQGFFYTNEGKCFVVTPSHVIEDAKQIKALTASRKSYDAKLVKNFEIDLALLELKAEKKVCKGAVFSQPTKLSSLLKIYEEGVLKSKLADGSTLQTKVNIVGVDETEFLQIKPQKIKTTLKQGYSGSILFIANQPSGILLEVDDGNGYVYRADALNKRLEEHFYPNGKINNSPKETPAINEKIEGKLAQGQTIEFKFFGEKNSPIEFIKVPSEESVLFRVEIIDGNGITQFKKNGRSSGTSFSGKQESYAFTPKKSGTFTFKVIGRKGNGSFGFRMNLIAHDSELSGEGNVIELGDEFSGRLAKGSIAKYKFYGEKNSPIEFIKVPSDESVSYRVEIIDSNGITQFKKNGRSSGTSFSGKQESYAFTPKKSGTFTFKVIGRKGNGSFGFRMNLIAHDSELSGEGNVIELGDEFSGRLAKGSIAKYKFYGEKNSPIEFIKVPSDESVSYRVEIIDGNGITQFKKNGRSSGTSYSDKQESYAFTPKKSGTFTFKVTGRKGNGSFAFLMNDFNH
ncbi:S1C family serine protease [Thalassotalea marina]|uniref:Serine protease n=1 Tax=Thalassotalea marina TaxID=1673741 RepID=A0A919BJK5_9GAMM|nr:S1C family serine protease [Thalassotalea marina]GHF94879.1 hypothetical protein GCM10017161_23980 [Thalassotalea marina]